MILTTTYEGLAVITCILQMGNVDVQWVKEGFAGGSVGKVLAQDQQREKGEARDWIPCSLESRWGVRLQDLTFLSQTLFVEQKLIPQ